MIKNKLKGLAWIFLTGTLALGNFACNGGSSPDYTAEIKAISKRTGYSEDKIYDMIGKTLDRMMSIPDQPSSSYEIITKRQNYEMKAEIGKKMFYRLADEFGNQDYMTSNDEFDSLGIVFTGPKGSDIITSLLDRYLGNKDGKLDNSESEKINDIESNDPKDDNKRCHGLMKYFPGLIVIEEGFN